jgi:hypothetical protein
MEPVDKIEKLEKSKMLDEEIKNSRTKNWAKLWDQLIICINEVQLPMLIITGATVVICISVIIMLFKLISIDSKLDYIAKYTLTGLRLF